MAADLFALSVRVADSYLNPYAPAPARAATVRLGLLEHRRAAPDRVDGLLHPPAALAPAPLVGEATVTYGELRCAAARARRRPA